MNQLYSVIDERYHSKIIADDRSFSVRIKIDSSTELTGTTIQDISLDEVINSTDTLTMGCACSNKVTINLINPPRDIDYNGLSFTAEIGLLVNDRPITHEWIPLGKFYGATAETSNDFKNLKLTAYDGFCKMTDKYNASVPENTTLQAVYDDLKTQLYENCGVTLGERTLPNYSVVFPYLDITYMQAVAYVAGCLGEVARFNRNGELEMVWYTNSELTIGRDQQYMSGFKRTTDKPLIITSLSTGTQETPIVKGEGANGTAISFENPYITDEMATDIFNRVNGLTYTPSQTKWRGNPAIMCGDIVQVLDKDNVPHTVLVMSQSIKVGGGCNATIDCKGNSTTVSEFSGGFESVGQKIERVYSTLEKAILDATNAITGNSGGYVTLHDTNGDGKPDEILVTDLEDYMLATKVWRWNKEGLGFASNPNGNAYAGAYGIALTADGQINADFITTGRLNANMIAVESYNGNGVLTDYIHFGDGEMIFGEGDNAVKLKLENDKIAFYEQDTEILRITPNSFEIFNITDGRVRIQNFGFIPRASGNLTFTLLS